MKYTPTTYANRLNIHPGDWYFGGEYKCIHTILGSCVSLTAWHPKLAIGGLCHFVLPGSPDDKQYLSPSEDEKPARYASTALYLMKQAMLYHAPMAEYHLGLFGGSNILSQYNIGKKNIAYIQKWMSDEKITARKIDIGGNISRTIILNILTGAVIVKYYSI